VADRGDLPRALARWTAAGVIDRETAARIEAFERTCAGTPALRWPIVLALALGGLMLASGILLFVSARWDLISPGTRLALVLGLVSGVHVAAGVIGSRFPGLSSTLHGVGTIALGAGIFLAGRIFNLDEHWPAGVMLWALGAAAGWLVLRQLPQLALVAVLAPAWLASEWIAATRHTGAWNSAGVLECGIFTLALAYFTARARQPGNGRAAVLVWVGGLALVPASIYLAAMSADRLGGSQLPPPPAWLVAFGWTIALGAPLLVSFLMRGSDAWLNVAAAAWTAATSRVYASAGEAALYVWWAVGAIGLIAWGVRERRRERINMGAAMFAVTVVAFYFSEVMDRLGRSASLVGLGMLFLAGGWALERVRRRLVLEARSDG